MCKTCSKAFERSRDLIIHERIHSGERPFECKKCNKTFSTSKILRKHIKRLHMNKCEICDKMFFENSDLSSHLKDHQDKKGTNRCNVCGRFVTKANLEKHLLKAHGSSTENKSTDKVLKQKKSTECNLCGKTFSIKNLKRHQQNIHKNQALGGRVAWQAPPSNQVWPALMGPMLKTP